MLRESQYYKDAAAVLKKADTLIIQREGDRAYLTDAHFVLAVPYAHYEAFIMPKLAGVALTIEDGHTVRRDGGKERCTETSKMQFDRMIADTGRKPFKRSGILLDIDAKVPAELLYSEEEGYAVVNSVYMHILDTVPAWDASKKTITGTNYKSIVAITMEDAALYVLPINPAEKTMVENIVAALTGKAQKPATRSERVEAARAEAEQIIQAANAKAARITETATEEAAKIIKAARETAAQEYSEAHFEALHIIEEAERRAAEITAATKPVKTTAAAAVPVAEIHTKAAPAALVIDAETIGDYIPADESQDAETVTECGVCACTTAAATETHATPEPAAFTVRTSSRRRGTVRRW